MLKNGSIKSAKLSEYLKSVHPGNAFDNVNVFRAKKARFEKASTLPKLGFTPTQKPGLEASLKVAYHTAQQKKPHTIAETFLKPCLLDIVELVCGRDKRKLKRCLCQMIASILELLKYLPTFCSRSLMS